MILKGFFDPPGTYPILMWNQWIAASDININLSLLWPMQMTLKLTLFCFGVFLCKICTCDTYFAQHIRKTYRSVGRLLKVLLYYPGCCAEREQWKSRFKITFASWVIFCCFCFPVSFTVCDIMQLKYSRKSRQLKNSSVYWLHLCEHTAS